MEGACSYTDRTTSKDEEKLWAPGMVGMLRSPPTWAVPDRGCGIESFAGVQFSLLRRNATRSKLRDVTNQRHGKSSLYFVAESVCGC